MAIINFYGVDLRKRQKANLINQAEQIMTSIQLEQCSDLISHSHPLHAQEVLSLASIFCLKLEEKDAQKLLTTTFLGSIIPGYSPIKSDAMTAETEEVVSWKIALELANCAKKQEI